MRTCFDTVPVARTCQNDYISANYPYVCWRTVRRSNTINSAPAAETLRLNGHTLAFAIGIDCRQAGQARPSVRPPFTGRQLRPVAHSSIKHRQCGALDAVRGRHSATASVGRNGTVPNVLAYKTA